jgi:hypothetical protein
VILYQLKIHVECLIDNCKNKIVINKPLAFPIHVLKLEKFLEVFIQGIPANTARCDKCNDPSLNITKMEIFTINSVYGDKYNGVWACPIHQDRLYYPVPIQQAVDEFNKTGKSLLVNGLMSSSYTTIAKNKFPWRCPICSKHLQYKREDCIGNFYT